MRIYLTMLMLWVAVSAMGRSYTVNASKYHPGVNGVGWVTASGDRIPKDKLSRYEIRWVALSPDLFKQGFRLGDTIVVSDSRVEKLNGEWVVKDRMGSRTHMKIDFLLPRHDNFGFHGRTNVTIQKKNNQ